ncbi:zinc finger protein JAGGED-like [Andrographis paniculata]|uniref:zinc finger protein JAGGED-like n=1 Tax=Andrographis paniculata TaxID=175694 RepID=UPI0021E8BC20|nr:zinc finger protein JAGGED-like [Andrographis paniculata]
MEHLPAPAPLQNPNPFEQGRGNNEAEAEGGERQYSCNYCEKKFKSKQALGGHQNAHKLERAIEKNARNFQQAPFGYFSWSGLPYNAGMRPVMPVLGVYNRSHQEQQILSQYPGSHFRFNSLPAIQLISSMAPPFLPCVTLPPPPSPSLGCNNPFPESPTVGRSIVPFLGLGSSSASRNQVFMNLQGFGSGLSSNTGVARQGSEFSLVAPGNDGANCSERNDSGLDLTLKL